MVWQFNFSFAVHCNFRKINYFGMLCYFYDAKAIRKYENVKIVVFFYKVHGAC